MRSGKSSGRHGEQLAAEHLRGQGYRILQHNYRSKIGEIDLIAREGKTLCFIEVKWRRGGQKGHPLEAVTLPKQKTITKAALFYLQEQGLNDCRCRFDVLGITEDQAGCSYDLVRNAFDAV